MQVLASGGASGERPDAARGGIRSLCRLEQVESGPMRLMEASALSCGPAACLPSISIAHKVSDDTVLNLSIRA